MWLYTPRASPRVNKKSDYCLTPKIPSLRKKSLGLRRAAQWLWIVLKRTRSPPRIRQPSMKRAVSLTGAKSDAGSNISKDRLAMCCNFVTQEHLPPTVMEPWPISSTLNPYTSSLTWGCDWRFRFHQRSRSLTSWEPVRSLDLSSTS